mmetsp:Transcript_64822/g.153243  ORF Transcript_64822/g.153243 Transcript_64822/m.153243 type:complete len:191 (-) Transcript_64822:400-972(-)
MLRAARLCSTIARPRRFSSQLVLVEDDQTESGPTGVKILRLNAPKHLNALTPEMGDQFRERVNELMNVPSLRAVVLVGAGRAFSAGGNLEMLRAMCDDATINNSATMRAFYDRFLCIRRLPVPTLAAVNGHAIGAGLALACACDMRVVSETANVGLTFAKLGLHAGMGSTHFLPKIMGQPLRIFSNGDRP